GTFRAHVKFSKILPLTKITPEQGDETVFDGLVAPAGAGARRTGREGVDAGHRVQFARRYSFADFDMTGDKLCASTYPSITWKPSCVKIST
ncbi:hypothetical protein, partial [Achromobacter denitrificans]